MDKIITAEFEYGYQKYINPLTFDYTHYFFDTSLIINTDCFEWLSKAPANYFHAIVTDPPYGVKEYDLDQLEKRKNGQGGVWRIPPSFDGHKRAPLPRFTALTEVDRKRMCTFFFEWGSTRFGFCALVDTFSWRQIHF